MRFMPLGLVFWATAVIAQPAFAHVQLLSASPAEASTTAAVQAINLIFSDTLNASASGFDLVMTGMPGMEHHAPMKIAGFQINVTDTSMSANLPRALPEGSYELTWRAAGADAHVVTGKISFYAK